MTFPILGGNGAVGGYEIANSLRFNDDDSPTLSRTPASTGNRKTWTWSGWVKNGNITTASARVLFAGQNSGGSNATFIRLLSTTDATPSLLDVGSTSGFSIKPSMVFRDTSAWYHIIVVLNSTEATASNRLKIYVNGSLLTDFHTQTNPSLNTDYEINETGTHSIGVWSNLSVQYMDGYMAEVNFIDGQALSPTDFGEFDEDSGIWKPIRYSGTYGTNGFYLDFENSGSLGADSSPNGNNFTPTNLASTDQTTDTPTNNFATFNSTLYTNGGTYSQGNLQTVSSTLGGSAYSTISMPTGKWYAEFKCTAKTSTGFLIGVVEARAERGDQAFVELANVSSSALGYGWYNDSGDVYYGNGVYDTYSGTYAVGDIIGVALDVDAGTVVWYKNGTGQGTYSRPTAGIPYLFAVGEGQGNATATFIANFGQEGSFAGTETAQGNADENGYGDFYYAPPSGYLALCTQNLATALSPTIDDGSAYFQTALWTGTGSSLEITNDGNSDLQPDFFWGKSRSNGSGHTLIDSSRGLTKYLVSNDTAGDATDSTTITSFNTDGFTLGTDGSTTINYPSRTYVGWQWKANGGTTSSNTDGDITSTVQVNATAGFSIVQFTKTGDDQAVGHGLGKKPKLIIIKPTNTTGNWIVMPEIDGVMSNKYLLLNGTDALGTDGSYAEPTSSVFYVSNQIAGNNTHIGYVFTDIEGYSKFGSYTGNGSSDGTFVYTGFRPAFLMIKRSDGVTNWATWDSKRDTYNEMFHMLQPNVAGLEITDANPHIDYTSNGFKFRTSWAGQNASGGTYIYMAFAESPFVTSSGVPVVAR